MQSKHVKFHWKHLMLTIAGVFLLFSLIYFSSCKKTDFAQQEQLTVVHDTHFKEQFFNTTSTNPTVLKIVGMLKAQNEKTDFISSLPAKCGLPIWEKLILPVNNSSTANWGPEDSLENIIIPLTENNANLSSLLYAKETASGYDVSSYMVNDYLYNKCHGTNVDTVEATKALSTFFYMECRSFGTTQFKHIPANLFTHSPQDDDGLRSVTIGIDSTSPSDMSFPHGECVYEYILCPVCHLKTCPVTVIIPHCGDGWPGTGGGGGTPTAPGGGGTNVPPPTTPPSGPGQGGGGDGGGPTGSPCVPDFGDEAWYGLMPLPPNNPCAPVPPEDTMSVLTRLKVYSQAMNDSANSVFQRSMGNQFEYSFILVKKGQSIYAKASRTDSLRNEVWPAWNMNGGEILLADWHSHPDPSLNLKDRPAPSHGDIMALNSHGHQAIKNYVSFIDCGNVRFAFVIEDPAKANLFFRNLNFMNDDLTDTYANLLNNNPNRYTNFQLAEQETVLSIIGAVSSHGIALYKSYDSEKVEYQKLN